MSLSHDFCPELALTNAVREWAEALVPGDEATVLSGVNAALYAYASGASVPEAAAYARGFICSRLRHPSFHRARPSLAAAS